MLKGFSKQEKIEFLDGVNLTSAIKDYVLKHGHDKLIYKLISSYSCVKGGIAFNNAKEQLSHEVKIYT